MGGAAGGARLGGRSAEEIVFGKITTGASNDLQRATDIAEQMVTIVQNTTWPTV